ncbi:MAG: hypothetical protein KAJ12_03095, partial [Bacteroidetes bacterium]|nr:hypothetical protein [Bacteroidota bacterium]
PGFALTIGGPSGLQYNGDVAIRELNLARLFDNDAFGSSLNADIRIEGEGAGLEELRSMVQIQIDSSEFRGLPIDNSRIVARAVDQGVSGIVRFNLGDMKSLLTAELIKHRTRAPRFVVDGSVSSLNLAHVIHDPRYDSDLTMAMNVQGTGLTGDSLTLDAFFDLSSSRYGTYAMDSGKIHLVLDHRNPLARSIDLKSTVADISLSGAYDLEYLRDLVEFEAANLGSAIAERYAVFDSSVAPSNSLREKLLLREEVQEPLDATYTLAIKDLEAVAAVAGTRSFDGSATLNGWIQGTHADLALGGELDIEEFFYGSADSGVLILDGFTRFNVVNLRSEHPLDSMTTDLDLRAGKILINRTAIDSVHGSVQYSIGEVAYLAGGVFDGDVRFGVRGRGRVLRDSLGFGLSELDLAYREYAWSGDPGMSISILPWGMHVRDVVFRRDTQLVLFDFSVVEGGALTGKLTMDRLNLDDFKYILAREELARAREAFSGSGSVSVTVGGTLDQPVFDAVVRAQHIAFRGVPVGKLEGRGVYRDASIDFRLLLTDMMDSTASSERLTIAGEIPVNLALTDVPDRLPDR